MGIFDKLKAVKNFVTGGGATVTVEINEPSLTQPFQVVVRTHVADADIKVTKVYLQIKAIEEVVLNDVPVPIEEEIDGETRVVRVEREDYRREVTTYEQEIVVADQQELPAGSEHEWQAEITLGDALPTFNGHNARHYWQIFAGLDMFGNDPDSGWVTFEMWE